MTFSLRILAPDSPGLRRPPIFVPGQAIREACPDLTERERLALLSLPVGSCHHLEMNGRCWCMERVS